MNIRSLDSLNTAPGLNQQIDARRVAATSRGIGIGFSIYADRAENAQIWDVEGRRFIDFGSGIAVLNTGHRHPRVMQAVQDQLERFPHKAYTVELPVAAAPSKPGRPGYAAELFGRNVNPLSCCNR